MKGKVLLLMCLAVVLVLATATSAFAAAQVTSYRADLVELNGSGVTGNAVISILPTGNLKVQVFAWGLVPCKSHAQAIYGFENGDQSTVPTPPVGPYTDGFIRYADALVSTGPPLLKLKPYVYADSTGYQAFTKVYMVRTSVIAPLDLANVSLTKRVIMLHGGYLPGVYTDVYCPRLPVAAAQIYGPFIPR